MGGQRQRIAVVGSGVAGLTAAYVLPRTHDVSLYEADDRLGGHAHTHHVTAPGGRVWPVDSGFIVHNERTYPQLRKLFRELGVSTQTSEMSMSVVCEGCGLQYAGARGLPGLLARPSNAVRVRYLRMLPVARLPSRNAAWASTKTSPYGPPRGVSGMPDTPADWYPAPALEAV